MYYSPAPYDDVTIIDIPHDSEETLLACDVEFPDGISYEVYPNGCDIPGPVLCIQSAIPRCGVGFNRPGIKFGTYQLTILTSIQDRFIIRRQRFTLKDRWNPGMEEHTSTSEDPIYIPTSTYEDK